MADIKANLYKTLHYLGFFSENMLANRGLICYHSGGKLDCGAVAQRAL